MADDRNPVKPAPGQGETNSSKAASNRGDHQSPSPERQSPDGQADPADSLSTGVDTGAIEPGRSGPGHALP